MADYDLEALSLSELKKMQKDVAKAIEPLRVCRRLQLLSRMEHHEQDNEQVSPRSA